MTKADAKLSKSDNPLAKSAVRQVASALRRDAIDRPEGELLGSEDTLIERYGVSRPTLRQAAALVSQENLLKVRRGVGGGYFVCRPDTEAVAHVAAIFLRSRQTTVDEVIRAVAPIRIELARLAAENGDAGARDALRAFVEEDRATEVELIDFDTFMMGERRFGHLLGAMSGNRVIALFLEILHDFVTLEGQKSAGIMRSERLAGYRVRRNRLAEAILEGDPEFAMIAARRCELSSADWIGVDDHDGLVGLSGERGK